MKTNTPRLFGRYLEFRDPLHAVPVKYKLTLMIVVMSLMAFGVGGYLVKSTSQSALEKALFDRLHVQAQASAMALRSELASLSSRIEDFASDGYIRSHAFALSNSPNKAQEQRLKAELREHLVNNKLPLELAFHDLTVLSSEGKLLLSARDQFQPSRTFSQPISSDVSFSPLIKSSTTQAAPRFTITTPLTTVESREPIGYLAAWVNPGALLIRALRNDDNSGSTAPIELSLLDGEHQKLKIPSSWMTPLGPPLDSEIVKQGIGLTLEEHGATSNALRRGTMLTNLYPIRNTGYSVEVSLDSAEAIATVAGLESRFFAIGALLAGLSFVLLFFPIRFLARPLEELTRAAQRLRAGELHVRVPVESEDEIGHLGIAFNDMATAIEERTNRLEESARDLRQQRRAAVEERLRLSAVIDSMRNGLVVLDSDGQVDFSNDAARPLLHMLHNKPLSSTLVSRHPCTQHNRQEYCSDCLMAPELEPRTCVLEFEGATYEIHATPLEGENPSQPGRLLVSHDISDRVALDERQMHQERLAVLGEVAAVMAHELNNPLAAIRMYAQLIEENLPPGSELAQHAEVISRNTNSCSRTIRDLLTYATDATPETGPVDIRDIIVDVISFLRPMYERAGVTVQLLEGDSDDPILVQGDELQLRQIFVNLVMNAIQALDSGGAVEVKLYTRNAHQVIEVSDNGPGISASNRERVFRAFFTTKVRGEGTGLGLSTARRIAELHGGGLELLESTQPGCTFRVRLRRAVESVL